MRIANGLLEEGELWRVSHTWAQEEYLASVSLAAHQSAQPDSSGPAGASELLGMETPRQAISLQSRQKALPSCPELSSHVY